MTEIATFAAGCFWGVQHLFDKHFSKDGVVTHVGYSGGYSQFDHPSYKQVCTGETRHAEVVQVQFDPTKVAYETLVEFFYRMHDPTQLDQQGPDDFGPQYRSAIFYHSNAQKKVAEEVTRRVQEVHYPETKIVTEITPASAFYHAEEYHQTYLNKNPDGYKCPTHYLRW
ncbi:hypothetical protein BX666DRAFT_1944327 [Dichotomocladium elegans]|nr:hypothetical protein BX666DRAFT_1944327 [Dichotomocladium elegans]